MVAPLHQAIQLKEFAAACASRPADVFHVFFAAAPFICPPSNPRQVAPLSFFTMALK